MKGVREFLKFDHNLFFQDKQLMFISSEPFFKYLDGKKTDEILGIKLICVITLDKTIYKNSDMNNNFEKISFKLPGTNSVDIKEFTYIKPKIVDSIVYGDYQNQLSITISGFSIISEK